MKTITQISRRGYLLRSLKHKAIIRRLREQPLPVLALGDLYKGGWAVQYDLDRHARAKAARRAAYILAGLGLVSVFERPHKSLPGELRSESPRGNKRQKVLWARITKKGREIVL